MQKRISAITSVLYLLFFGFRGFIGTDWFTYYLVHGSVPAATEPAFFGFLAESSLEKGFVFSTGIIKIISTNYHFFILVNTLTDLLLVRLFLKRHSDFPALGFFIFIVMGGFVFLDLLRNAKSILLFLLSLKYLSERNPFKFFLLNGLGMLFHFSAILYLPFYWILHRQWHFTIYMLIFVVGNVWFLFRVEWIHPLLDTLSRNFGGRIAYILHNYELFGHRETSYGMSIGYVERFLSGLVFLYFAYKSRLSTTHDRIFLNSFFLYFAFFFFFSEVRELSARLSLLFIFSYWVLYPAIYCRLKSGLGRFSFLFIVFLYASLKTIGQTSHFLYRYDNVLGRHESYEERKFDFMEYYFYRHD